MSTSQLDTSTNNDVITDEDIIMEEIQHMEIVNSVILLMIEHRRRMTNYFMEQQRRHLFFNVTFATGWVLAMECFPGLFRADPSSVIGSSNYWSFVHPNLNDNDYSANSYKAHYRVNRTTFNWLVETLSPHPIYNTNSLQMPAYKQIACVLWRFANTHFGYRMASVHLGIGQGSYHRLTRRFVRALLDTHMNKIRWPQGEEIGQVADDFAGEGRLPRGVIGAVDEKFVVIHCPHLVNLENYRDRKFHLSMNLLAVCDANMRFTYVNAGNPGRMHDAGIFTASELAHRFINNSNTVTPDGTYIIGDSAYPLWPNVITPYFRRTADDSKKNFNKIHSSTRMVIERAFGQLTVRWRFIKQYLYLTTEDRMIRVIYASCILHNICLGLGDLMPVETTVEHAELDTIDNVDAPQHMSDLITNNTNSNNGEEDEQDEDEESDDDDDGDVEQAAPTLRQVRANRRRLRLLGEQRRDEIRAMLDSRQ